MLQKGDRIRIHGYTDNIGSDDYNMGLSLRRAEAVKSWFVAHKHFPSSMIDTDGHGRKEAKSNTPEGRKLDRRVEIWLPKHGAVKKVCW